MADRCYLCPRRCGALRSEGKTGVCGASDRVEISKIMLHRWEEPCISGSDSTRGSGVVFFTHCPLGCVYCQNKAISGRDAVGKYYTAGELAEIFLTLEARGAYNINLVSPTHYTLQLVEAVGMARSLGLTLPVVWNTGGYELPETIELLQDTVDIFLTDAKYLSPALSGEFSRAPDYAEVCFPALKAMVQLTGGPEMNENGMMRRGTIVRHLVLPGCREDSAAVLRKIAETVPVEQVKLSLMSQYTPEFFTLPKAPTPTLKKLSRRITTFEYNSVLETAEQLGFDGYMQEKTSATKQFTPNF